MNEAVCMKNRVTLNGGWKRQAKKFTRQEFWKCIGCILSAATYEKKGSNLWSEVSKDVGKHENQTLRRDVRGTIDLQKVCCTLIRHFFSMLLIELFYRTQPSSFHGCFFEYLPIFINFQVCGISLTRFKEFRTFWTCSFVDPLVKVTDNFWKICGLIYGFNELHR